MFKAVIKWVVGLLLGCSTAYYLVCKVINTNNAFTALVDTIIGVIGTILNFIASHILSILIVIAVIGLLWLIYYLIITKKGKDE